jgi:hypothetical protein
MTRILTPNGLRRVAGAPAKGPQERRFVEDKTCGERQAPVKETPMEVITRLAWLFLAAIHVPPALVAVFPGLMGRLYGVAPAGEIGLMLSHRAVLFLAVAVGCAWGAFDPDARRPLSLVVTISVAGFLWLFVTAGAPRGALRTIAIVDAIAMVPLAWILLQAWRPSAA